jgi:CYTH domain-containing protein
MAQEIELEKTYLAKYLPDDLKSYKYEEMEDLYLPKGSAHARLRIRKKGNIFCITKKEPVVGQNSSVHTENTILLNDKEYKAFDNLNGDRINKKRFNYSYQGQNCEIDVFTGKLSGLVLVDFEFSDVKDLINFKMPDFCLVDVTEEEFIAGGVLCKSSIKTLKNNLIKFNYKRLLF